MRPRLISNISRRPARPRKLMLLVSCIAAMSGVAATSALADSEIEGVWSFNGGQGAVKALPDGMFEGVVVTATKFAQCVHPVGETMWTNITQQPDGSYWGLHQWFFETSCVANPILGPTAWRVLNGGDDSRFLRVCFSEPGKSQPMIAADGSSTEATYGCSDSSLVAPLPVTSTGTGPSGNTGGEKVSFDNTVKLPKPAVCVKHSSLKIKLHQPKYAPLKEVVVTVKGKQVADIRGAGKLKHEITLKGLPSGSYTISVTATTVLGQKLAGKQVYHSCGKHSGSSTVPLSHVKGKKKKKH